MTDQTTTPKLLPCPLCGGEASIETNPHYNIGGGDSAFWVSVGCHAKQKNQFCQVALVGPGWYNGRTKSGDDKLVSEAIIARNTRAPPATDMREVVEALRKELEWYANTLCEAGKYAEYCGRLASDDCAGCRARAALTKLGEA